MSRPIVCATSLTAEGLLDHGLLRTDTEAARKEIQRRVEHRRAFRLPLHGLARDPADYEAASDATILLMDELGVTPAIMERRRRVL